jgi:23S rRNA (cytidine1920-2'-O)/16S rRNA (cytidine1409-2'-O)-methyltransferase
VLIKPQFEAGKHQVGKGGVVRDLQIHEQVVRTVMDSALASGFFIGGLLKSPLKGPKGNIEYLALLNRERSTLDIDELVSSVIPQEPS